MNYKYTFFNIKTLYLENFHLELLQIFKIIINILLYFYKIFIKII